MQRCLSGDVDAYEALVERYGGRVYNVALRITHDPDAARDCAQDAFIRAYRALHQYDPAYPFGPWLFRITTNASLNFTTSAITDGTSNTVVGGAVPAVQDSFLKITR